MPTLTAGQTVTLDLGPNDAYTASATGQGRARIQWIEYGTPKRYPYQGTEPTKYGPFGCRVTLVFECFSGALEYAADGADKAVTYDPVRGVLSAAGSDLGTPVLAEVNSVTGMVEIPAVTEAFALTKNELIANGGSGATSGWLPASTSPERFALLLTIATGGAAASLTLDASEDATVSAAQIATAALDVVGQSFITPPLGIPYKFIRWTVVSAGTGNVQIARGV